MSETSSKISTDKTPSEPTRPNTSSSLASNPFTPARPNTSSSLTSNPFATPVSSRPPSIIATSTRIAGPSKVSFSETTSTTQNYLTIPPRTGTIPASRSNLSARSSSSRLSNVFPKSESSTTSASGVQLRGVNDANVKTPVPRMRSHMLPEGIEVPKPWTDVKNPRAAISYWMVYAIIFMGLAGGAVQCYFTYTGVALDKQPLCLVMEENFDNETAVFGPGGTFFREVNMDGFGNGEFEMTTASTNNSYVSNGHLYIVPTLTSDNIGTAAVLDGTVYNITDCTFNTTAPDNGWIDSGSGRVFDWDSYYRSCSAVSNATSGSIINPVQSARLTTQFSASIKFGRVEIRAKMPNGDWLWPAMWMLPKDNVYGAWPLSGEIDIVESRGNGLRYTAHGSNYVNGALNWGPTLNLNGVSLSHSWWTEKRTSFASDFHTYALEWTEDFLRIYVDSRLHTLLDMRFNVPFFQRGNFPEVIYNGSSRTPLRNPWINGTNATPFDQEFYLILNVAVGSTNGWFPEGQGDKPWLDHAANPMRDFLKNIKQWYPTWPANAEDRALVVDYVKMWKHC